MFGGKTVIDRNQRQIHLRGDLGADVVVAVQPAKHEAASVIEHQHRPRGAGFAAVIEAQGNVPGGPRALQVADHGQVARRHVGQLLHGNIGGACLVHRHLVHRGGAGGSRLAQVIEERLDIRTDKERFGQGPFSSCGTTRAERTNLHQGAGGQPWPSGPLPCT